jgi:hypothetical protein
VGAGWHPGQGGGFPPMERSAVGTAAPAGPDVKTKPTKNTNVMTTRFNIRTSKLNVVVIKIFRLLLNHVKIFYKKIQDILQKKKLWLSRTETVCKIMCKTCVKM